MKFNKPTQKKVVDGGTEVLGLIAGGMASRAVSDFVGQKMPGQSKYVKPGLAVLAILAAASFSGNAFVGNAFKGMAAVQGLDAVADFVSGTSAGQALAAEAGTSTTKRMAAKALGLACACDSNNWSLPVARMEQLASPASYRESLASSNVFEQATNQGLVL
jgi:hypothetical protein